MTKWHRASRRMIAIMVLVWVAMASLAVAPAASAAPDFGSLTARWWQWVFSQPAVDADGTNTNPVLDTSGLFATAGQPAGIGPANKYFFLAGTFGGPVTRTVTVPRGKTLFFPVFNFEADNAFDPPTDNNVPELKAIAATNIDTFTGGSVTFDFHPVEFFRSTSPVFDYTVPDENSFYEYFGLFGPQFEGRIKPVVADGYWAVLPPPAPGSHVLRFTATSSIPFSLDVTYMLTIQ